MLNLPSRPADPAAASPPTDAPLQRCDDCELNLGTGPGITLRAAFACPRFGQPRAGVESRCRAFVAKVAVLSAALSLSACATVPCAPRLGDSAAQVVERCGQPAEVFSAPSSSPFGITHEEWRYDGDVYVGLMGGVVAYVLD